MYSVEFIFQTADLDEAFHTLDAAILASAESMPGYLGKHGWQSEDGKQRNSIYYWRDEAALKAFSADPQHLQAKRQYQKWYSGYQVVISEVKRSYGDGQIEHISATSP